MPVPPKRRSKSKLKRTRAHRALKKLYLVLCGHCKKVILPHAACPFCGFYKGRKIFEVKMKSRAHKEHAHN